ncbi:MAG: PQQ-binding-like beta-propeller repeat protein [Acidobacteriota bacterium]
MSSKHGRWAFPCRLVLLAIGAAAALGAANRLLAQQAHPASGFRERSGPAEIYVPPALAWRGPLPDLSLHAVSKWSLRGEPLGGPFWADARSLVIITEEPESGAHWLHCYRITEEGPVWAVSLPEPPVAGPVADARRAYVVLASGVVRAYALSDGSQAWEEALGSAAPAGLAILDGRLLVAAGSSLHVLSPRSGQIRIELQLDAPPRMPPCSSAGRWYLSLDSGQILALDPEDGHTLWMRRFEGVPTPPVCVEEMLIVGTSRRRLLALRARDGRPEWEQRLGGAVSVPAVLYQGGAYVGSQDGRVYGFKLSNGHRMWATSAGERVRRPPVLVHGLLGVASSGETSLRFLHLPTGRALLDGSAPVEDAGWVGAPTSYEDHLALAADQRDAPDGLLLIYRLQQAETPGTSGR